MLVPADSPHGATKLLYHINKYCNERVVYRRGQIAKTIREVTKIVQDVLKEVEVQEPRFISSLNECNGHFEGEVNSLMHYNTGIYNY